MQPAMKMWLMEAKAAALATIKCHGAGSAPIRDWLQAGRGEALLMNGDDARPVRASDISVLVRSREKPLGAVMLLLEIPSVYFEPRAVF